MQRRSFFGLLSLLPGLSFLGPKPVEPRLPIPIPPPEPEPESEPTHTDLSQLFNDIRAFVRDYPGATVLCADIPQHSFFGWVASQEVGGIEVSQLFTIRIRDLKPSIERMSPDTAAVIREMFRTAAGKHRVAKWLSTPQEAV